MASTVWLSRHGNRQDFVDPEWRAHAEWPHDPGLSPDGFDQARRLGERLRKENIEVLFASPFLRTVQTAHVVAQVLELPIYLEPGFGEWMNTDWFPTVPRLRSHEVLARDYPRIDLEYRPRAQLEYPERAEEAWERAGATARDVAEAYQRPILIIAHGSSVTGAINGLLGRSGRMQCALCSLHKVVRSAEGWQLELEGDVAHLDSAMAADRFH